MSLVADLRELERLGRDAGLYRAVDFVQAARLKRFGREGWPLGACIWCEIDGRRRKATHSEEGAPCCDTHARENVDDYGRPLS